MKQLLKMFFHVPKTGGTTIQDIIKDAELPIIIVQHQNPIFMQHYWNQQFKVRYPDLKTQTFKFAFVRNPWDRAVSWYLREGETTKPHISKSSFEDWLRGWKAWSWDQRALYHYTHVYDRKFINFTGRFENFEDDLRKVFAKMEFECPEVIPKKNATSKRGHYRDYHTDKTKDLIWKYWRKDCEFFGYEY
jgi:hypothetical protein